MMENSPILAVVVPCYKEEAAVSYTHLDVYKRQVPLRGVAPPSENGKIVLPHPLPVYRPDGQFRHAGQRNRLA